MHEKHNTQTIKKFKSRKKIHKCHLMLTKIFAEMVWHMLCTSTDVKVSVVPICNPVWESLCCILTQKKSGSWWCKLRKNTRDRWDLERQRVGASILQTESMETCPVVYSTEQHRWDWSGQGELSTQRQEETRHGNPGLSWTRGKFSELLHVYTNIWCCLYCTTED